MNPPDLITEGISLLLFGMGFVFLFLTLLVIVTSLMSKIITRYFQAPLPVSGDANPARSIPDDNTELVAVISAAVQAHRKKNSA